MIKLAIVLNSDSGKDSTSQNEISKLYDHRKFELRYFSIKKGVRVLQRSIGDYRPHGVIAVGGDGTVNVVAALAVRLALPMGVMPDGTLNHFAKDMGIPIDLTKSSVVVARRRTTKIDYGSINDHVFVNNCSIGGYPETVIKRDGLTRIPSKWLAGLIASVQVLLGHRREWFELTLDDRTLRLRAASVLIGNNSYQLEGTKFNTRESLDSGVLQLVIVMSSRFRHLAGIMVGFILGRSHDKVVLNEARKIEIKSTKSTHKVAIDGEVMSLSTPLYIATHPKGLQVFV